MTGTQAAKWRWAALLFTAGILVASRSAAGTVVDEPVITSLAVAGTNLVFDVVIPAGGQQVFLEMRPMLTEPWQEATQVNVPADGGNLEFTIPMPTLAAAFFRLKLTMGLTTNAQLSAELQYVAVPPLGPADTNGLSNPEAIFHFKGMVDGSDRIRITREGAFWEHVNWGWPASAVTINGSQWNPQQKNYLTTTGAITFLPAAYSLAAAQLEVIEGRDVVALERTNNALIIYLDDTPSGAAMYDFKVHFRPATGFLRKINTVPATLKIVAEVDGSDSLRITARDAIWQHGAWAQPGMVKLNDIVWDVRQTNVFINARTNRFLPSGVDFSTAKIVSRKGRDVVTMWADADALRIQFADNPNGADHYELEISFGQ